MGRGPLAFRATDVVRAMKAANASGLRIIRTEIKPDGGIVFVHIETTDPTATEETFEQWWAKNRAGEP